MAIEAEEMGIPRFDILVITLIYFHADDQASLKDTSLTVVFFFDEKSYRSFVKVSVFLCGNLKIFI